jgi:putative spermidine/putrescine transport system ATP-binding protein
VTHDQTEAMTMSDRVVVMKGGRIEQAAPPLEVYDRPATRFVAEFVGDNNLLEATIVDAARARVKLDRLGVVIDIARAAPLREGAAHVLVRPERIRVLDAGARSEGLTVFTMKVATVTHFGDSMLITGTVGTQPLRVRVSGDHAREVGPGHEVLVGWRSRDAHVIGAGAGSGGPGTG